METYQTDIEFAADTGTVCGMGTFKIRSSVARAEPTTTGESRGYERDTFADLVSVQLGGLTLSRMLATRIVPKSEIAEAEAAAAKAWNDECGHADITLYAAE
ncbi:MAG: hypothetical protein ABNH26_08565 [Celeribacter sp.]